MKCSKYNTATKRKFVKTGDNSRNKNLKKKIESNRKHITGEYFIGKMRNTGYYDSGFISCIKLINYKYTYLWPSEHS